MRIGIDARQISHRKRHGLRTYVENLIKYLSKCDKNNEYILYLDRKDLFDLSGLGSNFTLQILPWHFRFLSTFINDHFILPLHIKKCDLDIMHYPANPVNFRMRNDNVKTITTIADSIPFFDRGKSIFKRGIRKSFFSWYNSKLIVGNTSSKNVVITISDKSREDLTRYTDLQANQIRRIHLAANNSFRRINNSEKIHDIKVKYNLGSNFILGFAHKNGIRIIEAYNNLSDEVKSSYKVGLIWLKNRFPEEILKIIDEQHISDRITCLPPVSENELVLLYNAASIFIFPSFYEGFGLPVLEAMQSGCPVICSNRGSLPEVAGDAALFVHELDDASACKLELSKAIEALLTDKQLREELRQKGLSQSQRFAWEKTAKKTIQVYEEVHNTP
jgi:glycosyltransferase involved in cell wall biosynthesis